MSRYHEVSEALPCLVHEKGKFVVVRYAASLYFYRDIPTIVAEYKRRIWIMGMWEFRDEVRQVLYEFLKKFGRRSWLRLLWNGYEWKVDRQALVAAFRILLERDDLLLDIVQKSRNVEEFFQFSALVRAQGGE